MGKWNYTLDVKDLFKNKSTITPVEFAQEVVKRLKSKFPDFSEIPELDDIIFAFEYDIDETSTFDEMDEIWDDLYDWADSYRVWIAIF